MSFSKHYRGVVTAINKGHKDAPLLYEDLLREYKGEVLEQALASKNAGELHVQLAAEYLKRKVLIQRIQDKKVIHVDLTLFAHRSPFELFYDLKECDYLTYWKGQTADFNRHISEYKKYYQEVSEQYSLKGLDCKVFGADVYLTNWVLQDFFNIEQYIPTKFSNFVSIGCGLGLLESGILQSMQEPRPAYLIDTDERCEDAVQPTLDLNRLDRVRFSEAAPDELKEPTCVISLRSCGFIYDVQTYNKFFLRLPRASTVLLDVRLDRINKTEKYFREIGFMVERLSPISSSDSRYLYRFKN
ncbi:MAG: hypothetical protein ACJZ9F_03405 [Rhodospirillaceae bacterium]